MSDMDNLRRALDGFIERSERRRLIRGVLGRINGDASITYAVPQRPDYVFVRIGTENGQLTLNYALNRGRGRVALRPNLPILMRREQGTLVIVGEDYESGLLEGDDAGNDYGVTPHPLSVHTDTDFPAVADRTDGYAVTWDGDEGVFVLAPAGIVTSVNGQTGAVTLNADHIDDSATTHKFATAAELSKLAGIEALADVTDQVNVGAAIHGATEKVTLADNDEFGGINSAASNVLAWWKWSTIKSAIATYYNSLAATLTNKTLDSTNISTLTSKTTPVDADSVVIVDSAASNVFKRTTWANIVATLTTAFNALYGRLASANTWTAAQTITSTTLGFSAPGIDHGMTNFAATDVGMLFTLGSVTQGGSFVEGFSDVGTRTGFTLFGVIGSATPTVTVPAIVLRGDKKNGVGTQVLAATETLLGIDTGGTRLVVVMGNGNMGFGTVAPQGRIHSYTGASSFMHADKTGVDGTAQTVIVNGTGDITRAASGFFALSDGTTGVSNSFNMLPGDNVDIGHGAGTWRLALNVNGELTAQRIAGSGTASIALAILWI